MPNCDKLLEHAQRSPQNMRFAELCQLAECYGFVFERQVGTSHRIYKRAAYPTLMNFQDDKGKAKVYQVRQLLKVIDDMHSKE